MHCFYHHDRPAIGVCRACGKGVCPDCVAEVPNGIACRDSCVERVELLNAIVDNNSRVVRVVRDQGRRAGWALGVLGVGFLGVGAWAFTQSFLAGAMFTGFGAVYSYFARARMKEQRALRVPEEEARRLVERYPRPELMPPDLDLDEP